jgi:hypothetical protein
MIGRRFSRVLRMLLGVFLPLVCLASIALSDDSPRYISTPGVMAPAPVIVIGFVGGFVRRNASIHSTVQLAERLRKDHPRGVYSEVLENRRRQEAHADILRRIDVDSDGSLSADEKQKARIILYGHSWGASAAIALARQLQTEDIRVLLTVQVDSVTKLGQNDNTIPANVVAAANFYQLDGFLHGQREIRAADPKRTQIIGNFRSEYKAHPIDCKQYPWYNRLFMKAHIEIECDPKVWSQVESLIQDRLPQQH